MKRKQKILSQLDLVLMPKKQRLSCTVRYEKQLVFLIVGINTFTRKYTGFLNLIAVIAHRFFLNCK